MAIHTFAEMVALAQSKGGRCLSAPSDFVDTKSVLRFTCAAGHEWTTRVTTSCIAAGGARNAEPRIVLL